ncbi:nickel-dependent lactate racemase [Clostridium sp.]
MKEFKLKYGRKKINCSIPDENLIDVISGNDCSDKRTEKEIIMNALQYPIYSAKLKELVHKGETVGILVSDNTRLWQKMYLYLPYIVKEILEGGVNEKDIIFLIANGAHRKPTEDEYKQILGPDIYGKYKIVQHDCHDEKNLVYLGETTRGTPVEINKIAYECDHIILTGAIVYHFLTGWSGGKKSILPGISSFRSLTANHYLCLADEIGKDVTNPNVRCGNIINNPIHEDMIESASFVRPTFMFNVIIGSEGNISAAVAGNYIKAHEQGRDIVDGKFGVTVKEKADLIISSVGGFPRDTNLYQSIKAMFAVGEALKEGGTLIVLAECSDGLGGDSDFKDMFLNYSLNLDREKELHSAYTISKFTSFFSCNMAEHYNLILVSNIDGQLLKNTKLKTFKTLNDAIDYTYKEKGGKLRTYIMPNGTDILPKFEE